MHNSKSWQYYKYGLDIDKIWYKWIWEHNFANVNSLLKKLFIWNAILSFLILVRKSYFKGKLFHTIIKHLHLLLLGMHQKSCGKWQWVWNWMNFHTHHASQCMDNFGKRNDIVSKEYIKVLRIIIAWYFICYLWISNNNSLETDNSLQSDRYWIKYMTWK
jgi:hypothetical protein